VRRDLRSLLHLLACAVVLTKGTAEAQTPDPRTSISELKKLSVDQLVDVEVTSVSRAAERLGGAAAAVTVVTNEDIRRSGATTVPDALRMVPGIYVGRQTSNQWAVSSRGFSSINSEKLLVLSDTRSVYTPLVSGVAWDVQDYLLQDIDRIEVIRGPGATLWGSNAVNGVINITTKSAKDTQGVYAETRVGTDEHAGAAARYGGRIGDEGYYRVFGSFVDRDGSFVPTALPTSDDWQLGHMGARTDWESDDGASLTIQGDVYRSTIGRLAPSVAIIGRPGPVGALEVDAKGGNILGRYRRRAGDASEVELRVYYDRTHRNDPSFVDDLHTFDAEFQHRIAVGARQELTWGISDRFMANRNEGKGLFRLEPASARDNLISAFVQDQVAIRDSLHLTVGTKLEHNDFSGFEVQPSGRIAWDLSGYTLWAAVSRAVRVPTRLERDIAIDVTDPAANPVARWLGDNVFDSEALLAYELGYRWQIARPLFIDVAAFHNRYDGLVSLELELEGAFLESGSGRTVVPVRNRNLTDGHSQGVEILGTISPRREWRLVTSYGYVDMNLTPQGQDLNRGRFLEGATPRHQVGVRSLMDLPASFQLDAQFRSVSAIRQLPPIVTGEGIDGYAELDLRLGWGGWRQMDLSLVGRNLLHGRHPEFGPPEQRGEVAREVYAKVAWGF
jgi:iron complex outermembrane receptor protein